MTPPIASAPQAGAQTTATGLVVVCALPAEARALAGLAGARLLVAGMGRRLAARAAACAVSLRPDAVVTAGFCGGLAPDLAPGDVLVAVRVVDAATGESFAADPGLLDRVPGRRGTLVTSGRLARTPAERALLPGDAVDMESAAVARACAAAGVPHLAVRAVTDAAHRPLPDLLHLVDHLGRPRAAALARHLARRPHDAAALARMGGGARRAGAALAAALAGLDPGRPA